MEINEIEALLIEEGDEAIGRAGRSMRSLALMRTREQRVRKLQEWCVGKSIVSRLNNLCLACRGRAPLGQAPIGLAGVPTPGVGRTGRCERSQPADGAR
eukprot:2974236-Heterocapsa_arctica.AAC.1